MLTSLLIAIALLLAAAALLNFAFGRLPKADPAPGHLIEIDGRALHYIEQQGESLPVVMLHGMPSTAQDFNHVIARLPNVHAIAFDRPGYGDSRGRPLAFDDQVTTIAEALTRLGVTRAIIVGHSFGATIAFALAIRHPQLVAGLVLVAPASGGSRVGEQQLRQSRAIRLLERPLIRIPADLFFLRALRKVAGERGARASYGEAPENAAARRRAVTLLTRHDSIAALANDRLQFNAVARRQRDKISSISTPTIIVHGRHDPTVPFRNAQRLHDAIRGSELWPVKGNHILLDTHPDKVASAALELLARQPATDRKPNQ